MIAPLPETPPTTATGPERQPSWFLVLYALAVAGGSGAYVPLLTVLLPSQITTMQGGEDVGVLAQVTFLGAVVASLANIGAGLLSDRSRVRRPWVIAGLALSSGLLLLIGRAGSAQELVVLVMAWQVALNMMLAPLLAWGGDCFPDSQKGELGGALALAPALGALAGSLVTIEGLIASDHRLVVVAAMVALLVLPAVLCGSGRMRPALMRTQTRPDNDLPVAPDAAVRRMWTARFLVQIAEGGMFAFLLYWLRSLSPGFPEHTAANIFSAVLVASVPLSLLLGRWSDRRRRPILPLAVCATLSAAGMLVMAGALTLTVAIAGYVLFGIAASIFLALHSSQTLRVLPTPEHRARDLGFFNLTNTVPGMVMPWLTVLLVPQFGYSALFVLFAGLALVSAGLLASFARRI